MEGRGTKNLCGGKKGFIILWSGLWYFYAPKTDALTSHATLGAFPHWYSNRRPIVKMGIIIVLILLTGVALSSPTTAQQQVQDLQLVEQIGGSTYAVAVQGNYAYVGVGPRLVILDISDPTHPHVSRQD